MTPTLHLYCGIDSATAHHDVAVIDDDGRVVARGRVGNDAAGFAQSERCVIIFGLVWGS
jgi:transposase